ncbi:MAG: hypothetical protein J2P58_09285 [Acidimicrobiaceae bacterium]|nr:hypothetical protein [Acidimicrobiaceae bacterium]
MATAAPAPPRHSRTAPPSRRSPDLATPALRPVRLVLLVQFALAAASVAAVIPATLPVFNGGGRTALLVAAFLPAAVAGVVGGRSRPLPFLLRLLGYLGAGAALLAVLPGDALSGLASGGAELVTGSLPAPPSGPEFGIAVAATYLASAIAVEVVFRGRVLSSLVPGAVLLVGALLVGTGGLPQPRWVGAPYVGAAALTVLVHHLYPEAAVGRRAGRTTPAPATAGVAMGPGMRAPLNVASGSDAAPVLAIRALIGAAIGAAVTILALPLAGVLPGTHARQPYSLRATLAPAPQPVEELSLLATYSSIYDAPPRPAFTADVTGADGRTLYWRLATFDRFNGLEWSSSQVFQRAGNRLPVGPNVAVETKTVRAVIHPQSLPGYLPAPDRPQEVSVSGLGVSAGSGELVLPTGVSLPEQIRVTSVVPDPTASELLESGTTPGPTNPGAPAMPSALTSLAHRLEASASSNPFARLTALTDYLTSSPFRVHPPGNSPIGAGYYQVTQLLKTHTGSSEQYAAAFAIIARAMGFHARLAIGYTGGTARGAGSVAFTTRNLRVWPEVELAGIGWQPLPADPSGIGLGTSSHGPETPTPTTAPPTTAPPKNAPPPTARPGTGSPTTSHAGSAPPATSPPTTARPSSPLGEALQQQRQINEAPKPAPAPSGSAQSLPGPVQASAGGGGLPRWALGLIAAAAAVGLGMGGVVAAKAVRRRHQRNRTDPAARLAGAWEHTLDRLAEHGLRLPASLTGPEVADRAATSVGEAARPLRDLATAVDAARYDRRHRPAPETVEEGWAVARRVGDALRSRSSVRARIRAALSLAPFTRGGNRSRVSVTARVRRRPSGPRSRNGAYRGRRLREAG